MYKRKNLNNQTHDYLDFVPDYLHAIADILNSCLASEDISSEKRKKICEDFLYDFSMFHDQGELSLDDKQYEPVIGFWADKKTILDDEFCGWHEHSYSAVETVFKLEQKRKSPSFWKKSKK